ncbi:MAG: YggS family pyridoxal phosphate-dependent enzyme [Clostridiaceae bacterium]|nr:YggS family pyridoxal phosphate-dependent enzyme [Clostridiaceae bacterium]
MKSNIKDILDFIPSSVKLISVSKTRDLAEMEEAYEEGIREFGENKVQELVSKYDNFHKDVKWHLIGHLQKNKVKYIVGKVSLIHSLDSIELLREIEKRFSKENELAECLIQINIGEETSKTGIALNELQGIIKEVESCKNVKVKGLMAIIPTGDEEQCRRYFREMKTIWEKQKKQSFNNVSMEFLSMGMTDDYKLAIEEGSNVIRIGQGIFGKRL